MSIGTSCHFGHLLHVSKKSIWSLILYNFFHDFIHVYSSRACFVMVQPSGNKGLMSTEMSCHFTHLLQVWKKCLWSLILYIFFHDLIHAYSYRTGADSPQGTNFLCQQKGLITLPICCKFQRNLSEVWFYTFFSWFNICIKPQGRGHTSPRGQSFDVNRNFLSLRSSVASFKSYATIVSEKSIVLPFSHTKA